MLILETITNYTDYNNIQQYMKNNFITDYSDFRDYAQYRENNFTSDYAN